MKKQFNGGDVFVGIITRIFPDGKRLHVASTVPPEAYFPVYNPEGTWKEGQMVRCTVSNDARFVSNIERVGPIVAVRAWWHLTKEVLARR